MRRGRSSETDSSLRELARGVQLYRIRPRPPRQLQYNGSGVLSWLPPANTDGITHFRVYGPDEDTLIREVPGDQTQVNDLFTVARVFVSSYNKPTELESRKVLLGEQVGIEDGLSEDFVQKEPAPEATPGVEFAPLVTGVTSNSEYVVLDVGGQAFRRYGTFTEPGDPSYRGMALVAELGGVRRVMLFVPRGNTAYTTDYIPVREDAAGDPITDNWTFWFVSVSWDNRSNSIVDGTTPKNTAAVVRQVGVGGTNLKKARFFNTGEFNIDPTNGLTMNQLNVDKLLVGSTARFGFNGPGQWAAYDQFDTIAAWGGVNGGFYGLWGKNAWFGGSNPSTAPFFIDSSGNVVIDNTGLSTQATFKLTRNGTVTEIANAGGPFYTESFRLSDAIATNARLTAGAQSLDIYNPSNMGIVSLGVETNNGRVEVLDSSGVFIARIGGVLGIYVGAGRSFDTAATGTYKQNGNTIVDSSRIADFIALKINGTTALDSSRNAALATVAIGGVTVIDASRNLQSITSLAQVSGTRMDSAGEFNAASKYQIASIDRLLATHVDITTEYRVGATRVVSARKAAVSDNTITEAQLSTGSNTADSLSGDAYNYVVELQRQIDDLRARLNVATGHGLIAD